MVAKHPEDVILMVAKQPEDVILMVAKQPEDLLFRARPLDLPNLSFDRLPPSPVTSPGS
jgi:hypothetical protein